MFRGPLGPSPLFGVWPVHTGYGRSLEPARKVLFLVFPPLGFHRTLYFFDCYLPDPQCFHSTIWPCVCCPKPQVLPVSPEARHDFGFLPLHPRCFVVVRSPRRSAVVIWPYAMFFDQVRFRSYFFVFTFPAENFFSTPLIQSFRKGTPALRLVSIC